MKMYKNDPVLDDLTMEQHYLFLASSDSKEFYPENIPSQFIVQLPHILQLQGDWFCALRSFDYRGDTVLPPELYICSDICEDSIVRNTQTSVLQYINTPEKTKSLSLQFKDPYYLKITQTQLNRIKFCLLSSTLTQTNISTGTVHCILHLKKWL
jgi:hypothetical protein